MRYVQQRIPSPLNNFDNFFISFKFSFHNSVFVNNLQPVEQAITIGSQLMCRYSVMSLPTQFVY